jgi:hypothetical protein
MSTTNEEKDAIIENAAWILNIDILIKGYLTKEQLLERLEELLD